MTALELKILNAIAEQQRQFDSQPEPRKNASWWVLEDYAKQLEHGPQWQMAEMFGEGVPEVHRVRILRCLRVLEAGGLVQTCRMNGRLRHAKLTDDGVKVLKDELEKQLEELEGHVDAQIESEAKAG